MASLGEGEKVTFLNSCKKISWTAGFNLTAGESKLVNLSVYWPVTINQKKIKLWMMNSNELKNNFFQPH